MLTIRLSRVGKRKQPTYRFVVSEKSKDPWGKAVEIVGSYNPRAKPVSLVVKADRVQHWLSKGATASDTVWNLLVEQKVVSGEKRRVVRISQKRHAVLAEAAVKAKAAEAAAVPTPVETSTPTEVEPPAE
jgi:small subunit ribosomal protein S16